MALNVNKYIVGIFILQLYYVENGICQGSRPTFRILAPQFICPAKTQQNASADQPPPTPGATTIRLQTASGQQFTYNWTVRFKVLNGPRGQRFNLLVWRVVRTLEKTLTDMSPEISENNIVAINNTMLMEGVNYIFNISGINKDGIMGDTKSFAIKFTDAKSEPKFDFVEADGDAKFSVVMLGSDTIYADVTYCIEAEVTPCKPTNDYYFEWNVLNTKENVLVDVGGQKGNKLTVLPGTLIGGHKYDISVKVLKISDNKQITTNGVFLTVLSKGISIEMNIENITMAIGMPITITSKLINSDNIQGFLFYDWNCKFNDGKSCDDFKSANQSELNYEKGFDKEGTYEFEITITKGSEKVSNKAVIILQNAMLPVIDIVNVPVFAISGRPVEIQARVFELRSSCNLFWIPLKIEGFEFLEEKLVLSGFGSITVNSLEETFLSEIVEFGNETMHRNYPLFIPGSNDNWPGLKPDSKYKFRLMVQCSCSISLECEGPKNVTAFSDVTVITNQAPIPKPIKVNPISGYGLKDIFKFSTNAAVDRIKDYPLTYTFGYKNSQGELTIISTYVENLSVETILPYSESPLIPTLEVCDSRNGCTFIEGESVMTLKPNSITQEEIDFYLNKFEMQLYRKEYYDAFYDVSIILQTFKAMEDQELEKSFLFNVENITKDDILKQRKDISQMLNVKSSKEFIQICNKFIEKFKVSESLIQDILKLRDETFEVITQSNEIRNVRSVFVYKRLNKRSISPNDLKYYIDMSEYILSTSINSEQISKEKKNILSKLEISGPDLCKLKQKIVLDWFYVSSGIEIINLKSNLGFTSIPYPYYSDSKVNNDNIAEIQILATNNIPKQHCLRKTAFSMNFLNDLDDKRKGWIYHTALYDNNFENVDNFEVILKLPVSNIKYNENQIIECRRWNNNKWDGETCESNLKFVIQRKIEYVICKCYALGYYSLYVTGKNNETQFNIIPSSDDPLEISSEASTTDDDLIVIVCKDDGTCDDESESENSTNESAAVKNGKTSLYIWILICIIIGVIISFLLIIILKNKRKKSYTVNSVQSFKNPKYNQYFDENLMDGSLESLVKLNAVPHTHE